MITSDHGGVGFGNVGESMAELEVPWIISGPGVQKNVLLEIPNDNINTAPTIARILGLKVPVEWIGKAVAEAFVSKATKSKPARYVPKPLCSLPEGAYPGPQQIELSTMKEGAAIYYSLDGSIPGISSKKYTTPFTISSNCTLRAVTISGPSQSQVVSQVYTFVQGVKSATLTIQPSTKYPGSGVSGLFDGLIGSSNPTNKQWMGFEGDDFEVTIDLGEVKNVKTMGLDVLQLPANLIFLPSKIEFYTSKDAITYTLLNTIYPSESGDPQPDGPVDLSRDFVNLNTQYVRIKATNIGTCPAGQPGEEQKAWLLVSEVEIE
jgi:hypothetical protein